jgi:hypothetical protein
LVGDQRLAFVVATQFEILQTGAAAQQLQALIDRLGQAKALGQQMDGGNAASRDRAGF